MFRVFAREDSNECVHINLVSIFFILCKVKPVLAVQCISTSQIPRRASTGVNKGQQGLKGASNRNLMSLIHVLFQQVAI